MQSMRQKLRPKHQVLVLKCYPRYQKTASEVKPNPSELSYLLYYASTRRSKLPKVASYVERKTVSDVRNNRIGNVQVTLAILKSLIEKCPRDLSLYGGAVLRILNCVLRSQEITMVEATVPTFAAFCSKQDPAFLAADPEYQKQYEQVIRLYATFASKDHVIPGKARSVPLTLRFRRFGLEAIKSLTGSESLSAETGRQLALVIPVMLEAVYSSRGLDLLEIEQAEHEREELEKELAFRRRQSVSTVQTTDTTEHDAVAGTAEESDKLAEQSVSILALQALRQVFGVSNRSQVRQATSTVLEFLTDRISLDEHFPASGSYASYADGWTVTLFQMMCQWTPVQDRFAVLVTAVEALVRCPADKRMDRQCVLAILIATLLSSKTNFIGLSVMDVLVGLLQHSLGVLRCGGRPGPDDTSIQARLLQQLQTCIGSLANHIYYSEQISDMITAILARLRPSATADPAVSVAAIEDPEAVADGGAIAERVGAKPVADGFFSFEAARELALNAVKDVLIAANDRAVEPQPKPSYRSPVVDVSVWDGTAWLLRDPEWAVRKAYVDALLTWANLELSLADLRVPEDRGLPKKSDAQEPGVLRQASLTKRGASTAPHLDHRHRRKPTFLPLIHLAAYENAHQYAQSESDVLLLHLLLTTLVRRLGVNIAVHGLPMIVRLQEDIQDIDDPTSKVHVGALVHGYFWALSVQFDFDASPTGREIHNEISRRMQVGLWLYGLTMPPRPIADLPPPVFGESEALTTDLVEGEALKPFDNSQSVVDRIGDAYALTAYSPPSSPPRSPNRSMSTPYVQVTSPSDPPTPRGLLSRYREQMLSEWSREACIAATTASISRSGSITGSLVGTASAPRRNWPNATGSATRHNAGSVSPNPDSAVHSSQLSASPYLSNRPRTVSGPYGFFNKRSPSQAGRTSRAPSHAGTPLSVSSRRSTVRVEDLKRVLSSGCQPHHTLDLRTDQREQSDTASDSMVSAAGLSFEASDAGDGDQSALRRSVDHSAAGEGPPRPSSSHCPSTHDKEDVPPVPPLPPSLQAMAVQPSRPATAASECSGTAIGSVAGSVAKSRASGVARSPRGAGMTREGGVPCAQDLNGLLSEIDIGDSTRRPETETRLGGLVIPPY